MKPEDVPLPGYVMDGLFNARTLATIGLLADMAEQHYRPDIQPDYDPKMRDAILEVLLALEAVKGRLAD